MGSRNDFGARLRKARRDAGISQSEAAAGIVSASYLSLVEAGLRQPSAAVATALSTRLHVPLVADDSASDVHYVSAQAALRAGDMASAVSLTGKLPEDSAARLLLEGQLQERRGEIVEAPRTLERALAAAPVGSELWFEASAVLCRCALDAGLWNRAMEVGEQAIATAPGGSPRAEDVVVELRATLSAVYCQSGNLERARELTDAGLDAMGSPRLRAAQLWARSIVEYSSGDRDAAERFAVEALHLFRMLDRPLSLARMEVNAVTLRMHHPRFDASEGDALLTDAERTFRTLGSPIDLAACLSARAEFEVLRGNTRLARESVEEAILLVREEGAGMRAHVYASAGGVFAAIGEGEAAGAHLRAARELLEQGGARRSAAETWRALSATYEAMGQLDLALACMKAATDLLGGPAQLGTQSTHPGAGANSH